VPKPEPKSPSKSQASSKPAAGGESEKATSLGHGNGGIQRGDDGKPAPHSAPSAGTHSEEAVKTDGTIYKTTRDLSGRVSREEVINKDGSREVSNQLRGRDGQVRATETIKFDTNHKPFSRTVEKSLTINKTVIKTEVRYDRGRYGFVYHPVYEAHPLVFTSWYDPYWYAPDGAVIVHPFHYAWDWDSSDWYHRYHSGYWATYDVYPAPSYWVTDWMVAGYLADRYDARISAAQAQEEARLAREDVENARHAAEEAKDEAQIAQAQAAQAQAELKAKQAEENATKVVREEARMKELAGKANPNATPIDNETKETLRNQIEKTITEEKDLAEQSKNGENSPLPDVSKALADPKHIYPVSKTISVSSVKDSSHAGNLSEGDLLKLEPGQEDALKSPTETTLLQMRVMTSSGEEGEVAAGELVNVSIKDLQEFDSEFRSKLDLGLAEAEKNQDQFKQGVIAR